MIGRLVGALIGRKVKEKMADAVLDKVDLPPAVEGLIKTAVTGDVTDVIGAVAKGVGKKKT
jgi:hypothetical protein